MREETENAEGVELSPAEREIAVARGISPQGAYNTSDVAQLIGDASPITTARRCRTGQIKAIKRGRDWLMVGKWVIEYLATRANFV